MAKSADKKAPEKNLPVPDFRDVDADAVAAAQAALGGGGIKPLTPPDDAKAAARMDKKGVYKYTRWAENVVITQAYRTVTNTGLLDVTLLGKVRQSEGNDGARVAFHYYLNYAEDRPENHEQMHDRSIGAIVTLLKATGFMPTNGTLKAVLLNKMFPQKNQPGTASPLVNKEVIANITQTNGPRKDAKTKAPVKDEKGNVIIEDRDNAESFLPIDGE